jgi:sulfoxide reductase catalytic subunit YedY
MHLPLKNLSRQITPLDVYINRRNFLRAGLAAATTASTGLAYRYLNRPGNSVVETRKLAGLLPASAVETGSGFSLGEPLTPLVSVTNYNNFYEFSTNKEAVAAAAAKFVARPWTVTVDGLVHKPRVFDLDEVLTISPPEERIYRMRCVEAWSIVIPWAGFSLSRLLRLVEPMSSAKYVTFESLRDPERMPGQKTRVLNWPYVEGLRLDEAMHPLTLLASGLYGMELPAQNGAPLRVVIPWKYGFKGIKSIVRITLTDEQPKTTWSGAAPDEYGFLANVNPTFEWVRLAQRIPVRIHIDRVPENVRISSGMTCTVVVAEPPREWAIMSLLNGGLASRSLAAEAQ